MPFIIIFVFLAVMAFIVFAIVSKAVQWSADNNAPVETLNAVVVAKRTEVSGGGNNTMAYTSYFVTFELESGERVELRAKAGQYGLTAEGDRGVLTRQGTRFLEFVRESDAFDAVDPADTAHKCSACGATYRGRVCEYCGTPANENDPFIRRR